MYKTLTCNCKMLELEEKQINISYTSNSFEHQIVLIVFMRVIMKSFQLFAFPIS